MVVYRRLQNGVRELYGASDVMLLGGYGARYLDNDVLYEVKEGVITAVRKVPVRRWGTRVTEVSNVPFRSSDYWGKFMKRKKRDESDDFDDNGNYRFGGF